MGSCSCSCSCSRSSRAPGVFGILVVDRCIGGVLGNYYEGVLGIGVVNA